MELKDMYCPINKNVCYHENCVFYYKETNECLILQTLLRISYPPVIESSFVFKPDLQDNKFHVNLENTE